MMLYHCLPSTPLSLSMTTFDFSKIGDYLEHRFCWLYRWRGFPFNCADFPTIVHGRSSL